MIEDTIQKAINQYLTHIGIDAEVAIERPTREEFGDYSTSVALKLTKLLKKPPIAIAQEIINGINKPHEIEKIEVMKPGFVNFWVKQELLLKNALLITQGVFAVPPFSLGDNKKVMVEFAHPNTLKLFHIGHLRNVSTGEAVARILESTGNTVIRANYQGDVGLHIAKTIWKMQSYIKQMGHSAIRELSLRDKIALLGKAYAEAETAYTENDEAKKEILEVNKLVYEQSPDILPIWNETRQWSLLYFDEIYKRLYTHHDRLYFESECHKRGSEISMNLLKKGILEKSEGAIVFKGDKYGVDTRVFINSQGFPTYEGKELGLAELEFGEYTGLDKCIHVVTPEQTSFFRVTFKVEELIDPKKYKNRQYHLSYNWVKLKEGKMSSRLGNVVEGSWLIDETKKRLSAQYKLDEETAETLAVASVKYSFLKVSPEVEIFFDFNESISLTGNSAPYLIYTYVRTQSILSKEKSQLSLSQPNTTIPAEEQQLYRKLYQYRQVVQEAAEKLSPNILASYLFELSQEFNLFYQKNPIIKAPLEIKTIRLLATRATGEVLRHGLTLLGIKTVNKM